MTNVYNIAFLTLADKAFIKCLGTIYVLFVFIGLFLLWFNVQYNINACIICGNQR